MIFMKMWFIMNHFWVPVNNFVSLFDRKLHVPFMYLPFQCKNWFIFVKQFQKLKIEKFSILSHFVFYHTNFHQWSDKIGILLYYAFHKYFEKVCFAFFGKIYPEQKFILCCFLQDNWKSRTDPFKPLSSNGLKYNEKYENIKLIRIYRDFSETLFRFVRNCLTFCLCSGVNMTPGHFEWLPFF